MNTERPRLTKTDGFQLTHQKCDPSQLVWIQRWLTQKIQERSYPPQCAGRDALAWIGRFLTPHDALLLLEQLRADFQSAHPTMATPPSEVGFLVEALETPQSFPTH